MIDWERLNERMVTFCAVAVLFLGSMYYLAATAFVDWGAFAGKSQDYAEQQRAIEEAGR